MALLPTSVSPSLRVKNKLQITQIIIATNNLLTRKLNKQQEKVLFLFAVIINISCNRTVY